MHENSFMEHFAVSLFFIKPIPPQYFPKNPINNVSETGTPPSSAPKDIRLHSGHFNLLWLIKKLADESKDLEAETSEGKKYTVALPKLEKVFLWYVSIELNKQSDKTKKSLIKFFRNMMASLRNTGHLGFIKKKTSYYYVSNEGMKLFNKNRWGRKLQIKNFFRESGLNRKQFKGIIQNSKHITPKLWQKILADSETIELPKKEKQKKI